MHLVYFVIYPSVAAVIQLGEQEENQPYKAVKRDAFQAYSWVRTQTEREHIHVNGVPGLSSSPSSTLGF